MSNESPSDSGSESPYAETSTTDDTDTESSGSENQCPECGGKIIPDGSDRICVECGLIVEEDALDRGPEWRAFSEDERQSKSRVGTPMRELMHDYGLSTTIDWRDQDAHGRQLSPEKRAQMQRLRTWHQRAQLDTSGDRNLKAGFAEIERMGSALGVPTSTEEIAATIYRRCVDEEMLPGRSVEAMASAALYAAAREANHPRSLDEISSVARVEKQEIGRAYRYTADELNLTIKPADPTEYIPRFITELDLSQDVESTAVKLIRTTPGEILSGKSPVGLAAAAVYTSAKIHDVNLTQAAVSETAKVTEVTIRNRHYDLKDHADYAGSI